MAKVIWVEDVVCWPRFRKPEVLQLFVYLLDKADENGNIVTTNSTICHELGMSPRTLRTCLHHLVATNKTTNKTTNKNTHLTICDFASYKAEKIATDKQNDKQTDKRKETNKENISPTPPIKENNKEKYSSSTTMRAREEFIQVLKGDRIWGESVELRYQLQPEAIIPWIERFALDIQCRDVVHKDIQDAKRHFFDWLRIQLREQNNGQRNNPKSKAEHIASERERIMREVASAAPRECDAPSWLD